jgi:hypothetical protein
MAVFARTNGDANGVVNQDVNLNPRTNDLDIIISTGGKRPTMFKIIGDTGVSFNAEMGAGGAVEAVLRLISTQATIIAYQVTTGSQGQMSVLCESTGWTTDTVLRDAIRALTPIGAGPITMAGSTCVSTGGIKAA